MKKTIAILISVLTLASLLCVSAAADAPTTAGIYDVVVEDDYSSTVTVKTQTAAMTVDQNVTGETKTIDEADHTFYADAVKLRVSFSGAVENNFYLVLGMSDTATPTAGNIQYIDQDTAGGSGVGFTVYPKSLVSGQTYYIYLSSSGSDLSGRVLVATFKYFAPYTPGDVDEDGELSATDALYTLKMAVGDTVGSTPWTESQRLAANVDGDTDVSATDALWILQAAVGNRTLG